jgi:hypothetical protein
MLITILFIYLINSMEYFENKKTLIKIKKVEPEISYNTTADIVFVTLYTPNIYEYSKHSILNLLTYAKKYNYGVIIYNQVLSDEVFPCWNKVAAILENISKCKYLIWIDSDAIISNHSIPIKTIINKEPNYDLYLCMDIHVEKECINSGVMIIKNTQWSINLFKKVWLNENPHHHNDQNIIWLEIMKEIDPNVPNRIHYPKYCTNLLHPKVKVFPENNFNSNIYNYRPNDFILHLMGVKMDNRITIMRQINTKLKLDNYNNSDCIDVLELKDKFDDNKVLIDNICLKNKL